MTALQRPLLTLKDKPGSSSVSSHIFTVQLPKSYTCSFIYHLKTSLYLLVITTSLFLKYWGVVSKYGIRLWGWKALFKSGHILAMCFGLRYKKVVGFGLHIYKTKLDKYIRASLKNLNKVLHVRSPAFKNVTVSGWVNTYGGTTTVVKSGSLGSKFLGLKILATE